jgi:hypothetical protein
VNLAEMLRKAALRRAAAETRPDATAQRGAPPAPLMQRLAAERLTPDADFAAGRDTIHFTQFFRAHRAEQAAKVSGT